MTTWSDFGLPVLADGRLDCVGVSGLPRKRLPRVFAALRERGGVSIAVMEDAIQARGRWHALEAGRAFVSSVDVLALCAVVMVEGSVRADSTAAQPDGAGSAGVLPGLAGPAASEEDDGA